MKNIVIIGAGGVGKETALLIEQINHISPTWKLLGFIDDNTVVHNTHINGYEVLGGLGYLMAQSKIEIYAVCAIVNFRAKLTV